jgi:hypothetical protein
MNSAGKLKLALPVVFEYHGPKDEFIRDSNGEPLVHVGHNHRDRREIGKVFIKAVNTFDEAKAALKAVVAMQTGTTRQKDVLKQVKAVLLKMK